MLLFLIDDTNTTCRFSSWVISYWHQNAQSSKSEIVLPWKTYASSNMIWLMRRYLDNGVGHKEIKLARAAIYTWAMPSVVHVGKTCQEKISLTHFIGISGLLYAPLCLQHASNICMVYFYSSHHKREGGELTVVFAYDKGWPNIVQEASYF